MHVRLGKDLWSFLGRVDAICITTNGYVKRNGRAVMGKGIALEAVQRWPELPVVLARRLLEGNKPHVLLKAEGTAIVSFPVKPTVTLAGVPGWKAQADPELIFASALHLVSLADNMRWKRVLLPKPGCGNGGLSWESVRPVIEPLLDDRFVIVDRR